MYVFCTYKQCTNYTKCRVSVCHTYTKCIQRLIESYVLLLMYIFCIQNLYILSFLNIFASITMASSVLFRIFVKFQDQLFILKKIHGWIYIIDLFSINLIYFRFNTFYISITIFFEMCGVFLFFFFDIWFIKIQVIFSNFLIPYFLVNKKAVKFISLNTANSTSI